MASEDIRSDLFVSPLSADISCMHSLPASDERETNTMGGK